ncbi:MAG TPA: acyl-CoA thioesterase [Dissulfurispiraceae bacterium]|nr:acyl-CoA thioesterase [Dissulfurispiraceae bacterium]
MESFKIVRPEHLNHYGFLFGGTLLHWVDETAYIAASLNHPGCNFVTVGMDRVAFKKNVRQGSILRFDVQETRVGRTSVACSVVVHARTIQTGEEELVFSTGITFVCVDNCGKKAVVGEQRQDVCPLDSVTQSAPK